MVDRVERVQTGGALARLEGRSRLREVRLPTIARLDERLARLVVGTGGRARLPRNVQGLTVGDEALANLGESPAQRVRLCSAIATTTVVAVIAVMTVITGRSS